MAHQGNIVATLALLAAPLLIWWAYRRFRPQPATFWAFFGAALFMPMIEIDLPALPAMDKGTIPSLAAILIVPGIMRARFRAARPLRGIDLLLFVSVIGLFCTVFTNGDTLHDGPVTRQAMGLYDGIAGIIGYVLAAYLPFLIGRTVFRTSADLVDIYRCLIIGGLIYAPLLLLEVRLSPQLHAWVYGFFPHQFAQSRRGGGFRPVVFMGHGLIIARFMIGVLIAAAIAWKLKMRVTRVGNGIVLVGLMVTMVLVKSLGATVLAAIALPLVLYTRPEIQMRVAVFISTIVLLYPLLRATGNFPVDDLIEISGKLSSDRSGSLLFRFINEDLLLERALERPWFGWGGYGRGRVLDEKGRDDTVTDGDWIIAIGNTGFVGFVGAFGLQLLPILVASRKLKRLHSPRDKLLLSALALMCALFVVDLLPNSAGCLPHLFMAGVLHGVATGMPLEAARKAAQPSAAGPQRSAA